MYRFIKHWFQNSYFLAYRNNKKYKDHFFFGIYMKLKEVQTQKQ